MFRRHKMLVRIILLYVVMIGIMACSCLLGVDTYLVRLQGLLSERASERRIRRAIPVGRELLMSWHAHELSESVPFLRTTLCSVSQVPS